MEAAEERVMKPGRVKSLLFFVLLFAVAALALEASYGQDSGSGEGRHDQQMPQEQQHTIMPPARAQGSAEMPADQ